MVRFDLGEDPIASHRYRGQAVAQVNPPNRVGHLPRPLRRQPISGDPIEGRSPVLRPVARPTADADQQSSSYRRGGAAGGWRWPCSASHSPYITIASRANTAITIRRCRGAPQFIPGWCGWFSAGSNVLLRRRESAEKSVAADVSRRQSVATAISRRTDPPRSTRFARPTGSSDRARAPPVGLQPGANLTGSHRRESAD